MPLCGFNSKMLKGLSAFNEGLIEHGLLYRSSQNGESTEQGIQREISDMTRLLLELDGIEDSAKRILTEGMVKYAMGFYLLIRRSSSENHQEVVTKLGEYFRYMDEQYYSNLEGSDNDMEQLIDLLNQKDLL